MDVFKPGDPADEEETSLITAADSCDTHCSVLTGKCDLGIIEDRCITFSVELEMHVFISNIVIDSMKCLKTKLPCIYQSIFLMKYVTGRLHKL